MSARKFIFRHGVSHHRRRKYRTKTTADHEPQRIENHSEHSRFIYFEKSENVRIIFKMKRSRPFPRSHDYFVMSFQSGKSAPEKRKNIRKSYRKKNDERYGENHNLASASFAYSVSFRSFKFNHNIPPFNTARLRLYLTAISKQIRAAT